jgi:hypothetical protein
LQKYLQNIFSDEKITRIKYPHTNYILHTNYFLHDIFSSKKVTRIIIAKILAEYIHTLIISCMIFLVTELLLAEYLGVIPKILA